MNKKVELKKKLFSLIDKEQFPAASLFYGLPGIGKIEIAQEVGNYLTKNPDKSVLDLHLFSPNASSGLYALETILAIQDKSLMAPYGPGNQVFILDKPECMLSSSSNALLKIIEDPLPRSYFIFVSSYPQKIISTLYSRCLKISCPPLSTEEIKLFLGTNSKLSEEEINSFAPLARGSKEKAQKLLYYENEWKKAQALLLSFSYPLYSSLCSTLEKKIAEEAERNNLSFSQELQTFLEIVLSWINTSSSLDKEKALTLADQAIRAVQHHLKPLHCLENFFLQTR